MKWLRLTALGLCLGSPIAAPADLWADDPPAFVPASAAGQPTRSPQAGTSATPVPSGAPAFVRWDTRPVERAIVPTGGAAAPAFKPWVPARHERPVAVAPAPLPPTVTKAPIVIPVAAPPLAAAQAPAVILPVAAPPRLIPSFIVRGQMEDGGDRVLPSSAEVAAAQAKPLAVLGDPIAPGQAAAKPAMPVQAVAKPIMAVEATTGGEPAPDPSKAFIAPQPRTFPKYDAYTGTITGLPVVGTPMVYDASPGTVFSDPLTNPRFWASAEFLLWWTNGYRLPVLVTTSPATTPQALQGVLGVPGTTILYGGNNTNSGPVPGGRFTFGWNFDPCGCCGMDASYFFLARKNDNFYSAAPVLARPFFNLNAGTPDRQLTSTPGSNPGEPFQLRGTIAVNNFSDFWGADVNLRNLLCANSNYSLYGFAGFRYLDLHEKIAITENVVSLAAVPGFPIFNPGNQIMVQDSFATRNQFYGGQAGVYGEMRRGRWFVGSQVQLGLGVTQETITINGSQTVTTLSGAQQHFTGGLLALPSNIGVFTANKFSVVPQIGLRVGYNLTDNLRVFVGYDFLYWSNVVRPGDQIDTTLNVTQIPNFAPPGLFPASPIVRPIVPFHTSGFTAQGLSAGFMWRY